MAARAGDWSCPKCSVANFAKRSECFKCHEAKPSNVISPYDAPAKVITTETYTVDPEDPSNCQWKGLDMDQLIVICSRGKPGDWLCSSEKCKHTLNFASRTECMTCQGKRGETDGDDYTEVVRLFTWLKRASNRVNASPKYLGEWSCTSCKALNFAKQKSECFKCKAPKQGESFNPGAKENKVVVAPHYKIDTSNPDACTWRSLDRAEITNLVSHGKPGDWLCTKCCNHNYKARSQCKQCNESMPANGQGEEWFNEVVELFSWMKKPTRQYYGKKTH